MTDKRTNKLINKNCGVTLIVCPKAIVKEKIENRNIIKEHIAKMFISFFILSYLLNNYNLF